MTISKVDRSGRGGETPAVAVDDLAVRFRLRDRTVHAVNGVSFRLERGEVLGILGESGSGKSVTLRALMRLLPANCEIDGHVAIGGAGPIGGGDLKPGSAEWA